MIFSTLFNNNTLLKFYFLHFLKVIIIEVICFCRIHGELLGNVMTILLENNKFEKACEVMSRLINDVNMIIGTPKIESLSNFIDYCIQNMVPSVAIVRFNIVCYEIRLFCLFLVVRTILCR